MSWLIVRVGGKIGGAWGQAMIRDSDIVPRAIVVKPRRHIRPLAREPFRRRHGSRRVAHRAVGREQLGRRLIAIRVERFADYDFSYPWQYASGL